MGAKTTTRTYDQRPFLAPHRPPSPCISFEVLNGAFEYFWPITLFAILSIFCCCGTLGCFWTAEGDFGLFWFPLASFNCLWPIRAILESKTTKGSQRYPIQSKVAKNGQKMVKNDFLDGQRHKRYKSLQKGANRGSKCQTWLKMPKNGQKGQKRPQEAKMGQEWPNWPRAAKNGQRWPIWGKISNNGEKMPAPHRPASLKELGRIILGHCTEGERPNAEGVFGGRHPPKEGLQSGPATMAHHQHRTGHH